MKILLARPDNRQVYDLFSKTDKDRVMPPLGLLYLESYLIHHGHEVHIWDGCTEDSKFTQVFTSFDPDMFGVGATTPEVHLAENLFKIAKKLKPEVINIAGGSHFTALPHDTTSDIDYIISGEGEFAIQWLTTNKPDSKVIGENPIQILDEIPLPHWENFGEDWKYNYMFRGKLEESAMIVTSRGCPYRCTFCMNSKHPREVRFRSVENVLQEITLLSLLDITNLVFADENFALKKNRTLQLCREMKEYDLSYACLIRADQVDRELIESMVESGCCEISMGVETGDPCILKSTHKKETLEQIRKAFNILADFDLEARASFILGHPYETEETIRKTIEFACSLPIDRAFFNIMTPYPSSIVYDQARYGEGIQLVDTDWKNYMRYGHSVIRTEELGPDKLVELQKEAHRSFYTQPRVILKHIEKLIGEDMESAFYNRPLTNALRWTIGS